MAHEVTFKATLLAVASTDLGRRLASDLLGPSLGAGASCTVTIVFHPSATGNRSGTLSLYDDGGGSPQKVALTGVGT